MRTGIEGWLAHRKSPPRRSKRPRQLPSRRGPSRTPLPHSRPGPEPFADAPARITSVGSTPVSRKQHANAFGEFFSNRNRKKKKNKTENPTRSRKAILTKQGNGKLPPQSSGVRRLKGKERVCGNAWSGSWRFCTKSDPARQPRAALEPAARAAGYSGRLGGRVSGRGPSRRVPALCVSTPPGLRPPPARARKAPPRPTRVRPPRLTRAA